MTTPRTLILATRNQGKVRELRDPLARFGFDVQSLPEDAVKEAWGVTLTNGTITSVP